MMAMIETFAPVLGSAMMAYCAVYFVLRPQSFADAMRSRFGTGYSQRQLMHDHPKVVIPAVLAVLVILGVAVARVL